MVVSGTPLHFSFLERLLLYCRWRRPIGVVVRGPALLAIVVGTDGLLPLGSAIVIILDVLLDGLC